MQVKRAFFFKLPRRNENKRKAFVFNCSQWFGLVVVSNMCLVSRASVGFRIKLGCLEFLEFIQSLSYVL